jgi:hypothetical protein
MNIDDSVNNNNNYHSNNLFNVTFGVSVDRFHLGTSINEILDILSNDYPRLHLELSFFGDQKSSLLDLQVNIPQWGMRFRFQHLSQKLYLIDIYDFNAAITYNINGCASHGQEQTPTLMQLHKALGPSFPGKFISDGCYLLRFDGVGLLFSIPIEYQGLYQDGKILPITLPDKSSAVLQRIYIYDREFDMEHPELYKDSLSTTTRVVLQRKIIESQSSGTHFQPQLGTHFHIFNSIDNVCKKNNYQSDNGGGPVNYHEKAEDGTNPEKYVEETCVALGMTPQDILSNLGNPDLAFLSPLHSEPYIHKYEYKKLGKII